MATNTDTSPPRILIIGAGSRGHTYAEATTVATSGVVVAVAEPHAGKRAAVGRKFIWGRQGRAQPAAGEAFAGWADFVAYERARRARADEASTEAADPGVDAVFVCVQDEMHQAVVEALVALGGLHIMCEKPLATTLAGCAAIYRAAAANQAAGDGPGGRGGRGGGVFAVGHVLRYSPHNRLLRRLVREQRVIGDVLSVVHTEPVGWWHFAHSYVRGNWRRTATSAPSLLTKSCHDLDVLLWLLCSPADAADPAARPHLPATVASSGGRQLFRRSRKPVAAGAATNCLACAAEPACQFSARRIYVDDALRGLGSGNTGWPVRIVEPDVEDLFAAQGPAAARAAVLARLADDYGPATPDADVAARSWYGRCVFESDNDVCDEQVVVVTWEEDPDPDPEEDPEAGAGADEVTRADLSPSADALRGRGAKTATFHMVAPTRKICERYTHLYGVHGEIYADQDSIVVEDFRGAGSTTVHRPGADALDDHGAGTGHGGGDLGLTRQFVAAAAAVKHGHASAAEAQRAFIGCSLEEMLRSHALVFCAEEARTTRRVVDWGAWWAQAVGEATTEATAAEATAAKA